MNATLQELDQQYALELRNYLAVAGEAALRRAYELGRRAVAEGLGVLELAAIHQRALLPLLSPVEDSERRARIMEAAGGFLAEALSPFEMALRGFQEANATLRRNLEELMAAEEELCQQNQKLADAHQAVEAEKQRYRELFDLAPDGYLVTDLAGIIQEANSAAEVMFQASRSELANSPLLPLVAGDDRTKFQTLLERLRSGQVAGMFEGEIRMAPRGGHPFPAALTASVVCDPAGRPAGLRWLLRDVTERKRAEEDRARLLIRERVARAEAEGARRLEFLAEASKLLAASLDYQETYASVGRLAVSYLADWCFVHVRDEEGIVRRLPGAFAASLAPAGVEEIEKAETGEVQPPRYVLEVMSSGTAEVIPSLDDESLRELARDPQELERLARLGLRSALLVPLLAQGRPVGCISLLSAQPERRYGPAELVLAQDLAHRCALALDNSRLYEQVIVERDRAEKASRAKDEFVAILSHELRNPLMPIIGWARVFKNQPLVTRDSLLSEGVRSLERNALNIGRIVDDCLDLARITERKFRLELQTGDLNQIAAAAIEAVRETAQTKNIKFVVQLSAAPLNVNADRTRMQQVLMNLLTNAVRYTEPGGLVSIQSESCGQVVEVRVQDTGAGIAPDFLEHIFEPFRQGSAAWLTSPAGLGLGLAVVRQIVQIHGGTVTAESADTGCGSTFRLRLPLAPATTARPAEPQPAEPLSEGPLRVLVVEDSRDILSLMKIELESLGYSVLTAVDGKTGIDMAIRSLPDAIISDIRMPGVDGYELIRRLRQVPELASVPAIALTGFGMKTDIERALEAGYNAHAVKPIDAAQLSRLIRSLCSKPK